MFKSTIRVFGFGVLLNATAFAGTLRVPEDYSTIQSALVAASSGDVISVAAGTYAETLDYLGKDVVVESRDGPATTIVSGTLDDSVVHFVNGEGPGAVLCGFTITGGGGAQLDISDPLHRNGGGILILNDSSPTIDGNWIELNGLEDSGIYAGHWGEGGGIYVGPGCAPEIVRNWIQENSYGGFNASGSGGGINAFEASPWIHHNLIRDNYATRGGGVDSVDSDSVIEHNEITLNVVDWGSRGGGLYGVGDSGLVIRDNLVAENSAYEVISAPSARGGGMNVSGDGLLIERNRIVDNYSDFFGGGMVLAGDGHVLRDNVVAGNQAGFGFGGDGGGLQLVGSGAVVLEGNTFADNNADGVGPAIDGGSASFTLNGCIVWGHGSSPISGTPVRVDYTDLEGGWAGAGTGNLDVDPEFTDATNGDYSLQSTSPCIDVGDPSRLDIGVDLTATPRLLDGDLDRVLIVDMGALEFSNVHLEVRDDTVPAGQLEFITTGTSGMKVFLFAGIAPGAELLKPYGSALIDFGQIWDFFPFGTVPSNQIVDIPPSLPLPITVYVQELAAVPAGKGGNFSNVVQLDFE